jgi:hypothetical protein
VIDWPAFLAIGPAICLVLHALCVQREARSRDTPMPKLPDMSAAAVKKRAAITLARKAERAKEPPPPPVVKIRMAKPR